MDTPKDIPSAYPLSDAAYTGCKCPACGSENITNDGSEYEDADQKTFNVSCNDCQAYWEELYLVAGYTDLHYGLTDEEVPHEEMEVIPYRNLLAQRDELLAALKHIEGHWKASEQIGEPAYALDLATCDKCKEMARQAIANATITK
jgi:hypothetical protein